MSQCVGIIGCGQLGLMLAQAGQALGLEICFLKGANEPGLFGFEVFAESELEQFIQRADWVTIEREAIPEHILKAVCAKVPLAPNFDALTRLRIRHRQKAVYDKLNLPTAPWCYVESPEQLPEALAGFSAEKIRAKSVLGGYDGKGQWRLDKKAPLPDIAADAYPIILEAEISIDYEISVLAARGQDGSIQYYPLNHNEMRNGVLTWSFVPAAVSDTMAAQAKRYSQTLMDHLEYVGVLAMELFVSDGELVINEIAPRVHNTGHWSIEGCECSQFEQHLRAVTGMPLCEPHAVGAAGMCNLLGDAMPRALPQAPTRMYLHGYGKGLRPGRKMGHITLIGPDQQTVRQSAKDIKLDDSW